MVTMAEIRKQRHTASFKRAVSDFDIDAERDDTAVYCSGCGAFLGNLFIESGIAAVTYKCQIVRCRTVTRFESVDYQFLTKPEPPQPRKRRSQRQEVADLP